MNDIPSKKRTLQGVVVKARMSKTRVVAIERMKKHPKYLKHYTVTTHFKAHDEDNAYQVGDVVIMEETRPLSKEKRWRIIGRVVSNNANNKNNNNNANETNV